MKHTFGTVALIIAITTLIWIFFYVMGMPLQHADTVIVVAVVFAVIFAVRWLLGRRRKEGKQ